MDLQGRVALVTGGGKRLGRAIVLSLARAGADVYVHYGRSSEAAEDTASEARQSDVRAWTGSADLREADAIEALFDDVSRRAGRLDVLVNSAARFDSEALADVDIQGWAASMDVNLRAPFLCARAAALLMRGDGGNRSGTNSDSGSVTADPSALEPDAPDEGCVINIADLSAIHPWRDHIQHGVSKAGLVHLGHILARELAPSVRVNTIVPGAILPPPGTSPSSEAWRKTAERVPLRRTGRPSVIADSVLFLARNDFITGATLRVDGGEGLLGPVGH